MCKENEKINETNKYLNNVLVTIIIAILGVEVVITTTGAGNITGTVLVTIFATGMIACTVKKAWCLVLIIVFLANMCVFYYSKPNLYTFVWENANNNLYTETIDSVWYNQENKGNNDTLLFTVLRNKTCVTNSDCWYLKYFETIAGTIEINDTIKAERLNKDAFFELDSNYLNVHSTLMSEEATDMWHMSHKLSIYITPEGITESNKVVAINDNEGNIYLYAEEVQK